MSVMKLKAVVATLALFAAIFGPFAGSEAFAEGLQPVIKVVPGDVSDGVLRVDVVIEGLPQGQDVLGFNMELSFDPAILQYRSFTRGSYFTDVLFWPEPEVDNVVGRFETSLARTTGTPPPASGTVFTIAFAVVGEGTSPLSLPKVQMRDPSNQNIPLGVQEASVTVGEEFLAADVDGNGVVDVEDLEIVASAYGSSPGTEYWDERCDLVPDGMIDLFDVVVVARDMQ